MGGLGRFQTNIVEASGTVCRGHILRVGPVHLAARASFGKRGENRWIFLVFSEKIYRLHKEEAGFCMGKISVFYRKA